MKDHLFDLELLRMLIKQPLAKGDITLAVDCNTDTDFINMEDVTSVMVKNDKVIDIGKRLELFNGFNSGISLCSQGLFKGLE